jgi:DNA-binding NarL/FixJ family response regulator
MLHAERSPEDERGIQTLTEREREVLVQIAHGHSNREIAWVLFVSEKTVKTHVSNLFLKLGVHDRTQAALYAVRHSLLEGWTPPTGTSSKSV